MLLYALLAAALPLALALTCPCPPAPAASWVCGSDLVTYDSQCHLQCTDVQGLSLKHPGPCSATEELTRWSGCEEERQCWHAADCGCGEDDVGCEYMCGRNCYCGCAGYPRGGMDRGLWGECLDRMGCEGTYEQCTGSCGGEECASCRLDYYKCECECLQRAYPAPQRKRNWTACLERHQCHGSTCAECAGAGPFCAERCKKRCRCQCADWRRRDLSGEWEECFIGTQTCEQAHEECAKKCGDQDQDCKSKCFMAREDCSCECLTAKEAEWRLWDQCKEKEQCQYKRCSGCRKADRECEERCRRNCECRCLGIPADSLEDVPLQKCKLERGCETERTICLGHCDKLGDKAKLEECEHSCTLASEKCHCECSQPQPSAPESRESERVEIIQHCNYIN